MRMCSHLYRRACAVNAPVLPPCASRVRRSRTQCSLYRMQTLNLPPRPVRRAWTSAPVTASHVRSLRLTGVRLTTQEPTFGRSRCDRCSAIRSTVARFERSRANSFTAIKSVSQRVTEVYGSKNFELDKIIWKRRVSRCQNQTSVFL